MILNPTPATLFCGMGSHASSVFLYLNKYAIQKIYVIYSKYNTTYYEEKISTIKQEINICLEALDHIVNVYYIQINERDFLQSYYAIARLFNQEKNTYIITDLTAGHKIISYIMFYAYIFMKNNFKKESKLIYLFKDKDNPVEFPIINIELLNNNSLECFFKDIDYYNNHDLNENIISENGMDDKIKTLSLSKYLKNGPTYSGLTYSPSTAFRYKKYFQSIGFLDKDLKLSIMGKMMLFVVKLSIE